MSSISAPHSRTTIKQSQRFKRFRPDLTPLKLVDGEIPQNALLHWTLTPFPLSFLSQPGIVLQRARERHRTGREHAGTTAVLPRASCLPSVTCPGLFGFSMLVLCKSRVARPLSLYHLSIIIYFLLMILSLVARVFKLFDLPLQKTLWRLGPKSICFVKFINPITLMLLPLT